MTLRTRGLARGVREARPLEALVPQHESAPLPLQDPALDPAPVGERKQQRRERVHRELVLHQRRQTRDLLPELHRLDAQPDLDAVVGGADRGRRLAHSSTVAYIACSVCPGISTTTQLGRSTRYAGAGGVTRTATNVAGLPRDRSTTPVARACDDPDTANSTTGRSPRRRLAPKRPAPTRREDGRARIAGARSSLAEPVNRDTSRPWPAPPTVDEACWPFHAAVISELGVRIILCRGKDALSAVSRNLGSRRQIDEFVEANNRGWRNRVLQTESGIIAIGLTHPSRAAWDRQQSDPSPLVKQTLESLTVSGTTSP